MHLLIELAQCTLYTAIIIYTARNILIMNPSQSPGEILRKRWWLLVGYPLLMCADLILNIGRLSLILVEIAGIPLILWMIFEHDRRSVFLTATFIYLLTILLNAISDNALRGILFLVAERDFYFSHESCIQLIVSAITLTSLIFADKLIWKDYSRQIRRLDQHQLLWLMATIVIDLGVVFADWAMMEQEVWGVRQNALLLLNVIIIIIVYVQLIQTFTAGYLKNSYRDRIHLIEYYLEEQKKYYLYLENREQETKRFRHDLKEHLHLLSFLAEQGDYQQVSEYLKQMNGKVEKFGNSIHLNSGIAEAIVNKYEAEAKENGITFQVRGYFPSECYITAIDLCTILSNLIANALEAVRFCGGRRIVLDVRHEPGEIFIYVENDCSPDLLFRGKHLTTTKMDKNSHGFGLENVEKVVKANGGWIRMEASDGKFHTYIELNNQKKDEEKQADENCDCR